MIITRKHVLSLIILTIFGLFMISAVSPALADSSLVNSQVGLKQVGDQAFGNSVPQDPRVIVAKVINVILTFMGVLFLVLIILGGFQYMTAAGNEEKTKKAVGLISNAVIGLVIIMVSWMITRYVIVVLNNTLSNSPSYTEYTPY